MALTITQKASTKALDKRGRVFGVGSRIKMIVVDVLFGATDDYATNGVVADLAADAGMREIIAVVPIYNNAGVSTQYDLANKKIVMYGHTPTSATATAIALEELDNTDQATRSKLFSFMVFGR